MKRPGDGPLPTAPAGARDEAPVPGPGTGQGQDAAAEAERCEMCSEVLTDRHGHLVDTDKRSLACACRACYLLFTHEGAAGGRYRAVPERVCHDPERPLTDADWNELQIPVAMAFFFFNSALGRVVAGYPSPGGTTECELDLAAWDRLAATHPLLGEMAPDVEAIFVNRTADEVFLIPIDSATRWSASSGCSGRGSTAGRRSAPRWPSSWRACASGRSSWNGSTDMADLIFGCTGASADRFAVTPTLSFQLAITERSGVRVHAIALRCQIRIEPHRRRYSATEAERLHDLFGDTSRWANTVKPIQLATVTAMVPSFSDVTEIDLPVPCTYDLEVASARYLQGLDDGTIPLLMLFSGTVFVATETGFSVELVPWSAEASYRMPVTIWRDLVDAHFPGSAWLRCSRETLDALAGYKARHALPTWDATLNALLAAAGGAAEPPPRGPARHCAGPRRPGGGAGEACHERGPGHHEPRRRPEHRRRRLVRGVHPVPVPGLVAEEPEPLAVRRGDGARVRRHRPLGAHLHPGRVRP